MSMSSEEYTKDLTRRVGQVVTDLFGEQDPDLVEHIIEVTLFTIAMDVRLGRMAKLEFIGELSVAHGVAAFYPSNYLLTPAITHQKETAA